MIALANREKKLRFQRRMILLFARLKTRFFFNAKELRRIDPLDYFFR